MKAKKEIKPYIFISYAHDDLEFADKFSKRLNADGYETWIDLTDIHAGERFTPEIEKGIYEASLFVSLVSKKYVEKPFCSEELECARTYRKKYMPVYIEPVAIKPGSGFTFAFGESKAGFGRYTETEEDFEKLYLEFLDSVYMAELKSYMGKSEEKTKELSAAEMSLDYRILKHNYERITRTNGYISNQIYTELYPEFQIESDENGRWEQSEKSLEKPIKKKTVSSENNNLALISYVEQNKNNHIFITGEGGAGKTVALKKIFYYYWKKRVPVMYVPLHDVLFSGENTLENYIQNYVCKGLQWDSIKIWANNKQYPTRVILLLDGLNEIFGDLKRVVHEISQIMTWENIQIIITSRFDYSNQFSDLFHLKQVQLGNIRKEKIIEHLEKYSLVLNEDSKLFQLISNPLMLTLYTEIKINAEYIEGMKRAVPFQGYYKLDITDEPDTAGKILWNYLACQLYKATKAQNSNTVIDCFIALEYILPLVGYNMLKNRELFSYTGRELRKIIREGIKSEDFEEYLEERIEDIKYELNSEYDVRSSCIAETILMVISKRLCMLTESNRQFLFHHQSFRDFFAALYLSKQIEHVAGIKKDALTETIYSADIINYLSDILLEEKAMPVKTAEGIIYPGKKDKMRTSELSSAEQALSFFRGDSGEKAQNAVANLMNIMCVGRNKNLSNCDFSELDLRKCSLKGVTFVDWFQNETYPSNFDASYLDMESFISSGHRDRVTALCVAGDWILSGDADGILKIWSLERPFPILSVEIAAEQVIVDLAYHSETGMIAILTKHEVYTYDVNTGAKTKIAENHLYYKYIKMSDCGEILISYDTAPLEWKNLNGQIVESQIPIAMVAGCAAKNPVKNEFLAGFVYRKVILFRETEKTEKQTIYETHTINVGALSQSKRVADVCYNLDGTRFIIATNGEVLEFDSKTLALLHRKAFSKAVHKVRYYRDDKIIVGNGVSITVLNSDFSIYGEFEGETIPTISSLVSNGTNLFMLLSNRELIAFDSEMIVWRKRKIPHKQASKMCLANYGTDKTCFMLKGTNKSGTCYRYHFEENEVFPRGWNYEILTDNYELINHPYENHKLNNKLVSVNKKNPIIKKTYVCYAGIIIHGCSFKNVQGNIKNEENLKIIEQNGGVLSE